MRGSVHVKDQESTGRATAIPGCRFFSCIRRRLKWCGYEERILAQSLRSYGRPRQLDSKGDLPRSLWVQSCLGLSRRQAGGQRSDHGDSVVRLVWLAHDVDLVGRIPSGRTSPAGGGCQLCQVPDNYSSWADGLSEVWLELQDLISSAATKAYFHFSWQTNPTLNNLRSCGG